MASRIAQLKRGIARLIDAYAEGLLEKEEFEPKMRQSKERLARLETEQKGLAQEEAERSELRLVIGQLEEFTQRMDQGLEEADWSTRREIIRALVKHIEVSAEQIRIVYRVNTVPFVKAPNGGVAQDCRRRADPFSGPTSFRAQAFGIQQDDHLFTVLRYVEHNPLRAGFVARAEDWPWSSLRWWLQPPHLPFAGWILSLQHCVALRRDHTPTTQRNETGRGKPRPMSAAVRNRCTVRRVRPLQAFRFV